MDQGLTPIIDPIAFKQAQQKVQAQARQWRWDPETKAAALAVLRANGGNVRRSVRILAEMQMKVPRTTLQDWALDEEHAAPEELRVAANEALASVFESATMKFATLLAADEVIAQMAAQSPRDLAISAKVTIEAMQLLRGKPTTITAGDPWANLLREAAKKKDAPGT